MKRLIPPFLCHNKAVSYAISAVIITAVTITLILVASVYAYQVLEQQRGASEFEVAKKSILAFNDALENVAWRPKSSRSVRFTVEYGSLELIPNYAALNVSVTLGGYPEIMLNSTSVALMSYLIKTSYVNYGEGYKSYILGDNLLLVGGSTESFGRAVIEQQSGLINITLSYRVRAMRTSVINVTEGGQQVPVNYVDIWIIKAVVGSWSSYLHDFDLKAKSLGVTTTTFGPYTVGESVANCTVRAKLGGAMSSAVIPLVQGKVVFNVIVAEVSVGV